MDWRVGIDLGTNSLGWWAFQLEKRGTRTAAKRQPTASLDGGVYIFPDGREPSSKGRVGDSKAVARRKARGMRRNRDHGKNRVCHFIRELVALGLLPENKKERDRLFQTGKKTTPSTDHYNPYRLRAEALLRPLTPHELGRTLLHLGTRRGYKSNRKEASEDDGGKLKEPIESLKSQLGNQTLGQYLWDAYLLQWKREKNGDKRNGIRFRGENNLYPDRSMYANEFSAIRDVQKSHHNKLTEKDWDHLRDRYVLFHWPLRPVERGRCEFFPTEYRHWKDTPIAHDFRIYQELNALRWLDTNLVSHELDSDQRSEILQKLLTQKSEVKFKSLRRIKRADKTLLFPSDSRFNLESEKREGLKPHQIAANILDDPLLSQLWEERVQLRNENLDDIFDSLHNAQHDTEALACLTGRFSLDEKAAEALISIKLASGTTNVSRKFMSLIVPVLADQGLIYSDAVHELKDDSGNPLHHSLRDDGRRWSRLPYYGEVLTGSMLGANPSIDPFTNPEKHFGKINNPTVHVALNSLRRVVNTLIDRFGSVPSEIHIELTRDLKLPRKRRDEINADQARNQRENERIKKFCAEHGIVNPSANDIRKVRLWEELGKDQFARCCVYSGKPISAAQLFNGDAEIEHILPFSRTLDRSLTNLTLSMRWANRLKGNRSPFDAFHGDIHAKSGIIWQEVLQRISRLPKEKRNRFSEDAMKKFDDDTGFIARQLNDTAYMARMAARYLKSLDGVEHVLSNPGRLTALVRGKWHLNGILSDDNLKSRNDHRHHAVDAAVIALTDRSLLNEISRLSSRGADDRLHIAVPTLDRNLEENIRTRIPKIITAFKPDHGLQGSMYNDTAYGFVQVEKRDPDLPNHNLVMRKDLIALTPSECGAICDRNLRAHVQAYLSDSSKKGVKHEIALAEFSKEREIKRTRIFVANQTVAPIPSAPFKGYAPSAYACCDIWCIPPVKKKAKKAGKSKWQGVFWPYAETVAGDPDKKLKKPHPAARFVTRLFKDDLIAYEIDGGTQIMRVAGFSTTNNKLDVRFHFSANSDQNYISINVLGTLGLRKLFISPDGQILETRRRGSK